MLSFHSSDVTTLLYPLLVTCLQLLVDLLITKNYMAIKSNQMQFQLHSFRRSSVIIGSESVGLVDEKLKNHGYSICTNFAETTENV